MDRLTDQVKRAHHIASEQKRRQAIRQAYERLVNLVPELTPDDVRSEATVLRATIAYIHSLRSNTCDTTHP